MFKAELFLATTAGRSDAARGLASLAAAVGQLVGDDVAARAVLHDPSALADLSHGEETEAAAGFCGVVSSRPDGAGEGRGQRLSSATCWSGRVGRAVATAGGGSRP